MSDKVAHHAIKFACKNKNYSEKRKEHIVYCLKSSIFPLATVKVIVVHHSERQTETQTTLGFECVLCKVNWTFSCSFLTAANSETLTKDKPLTNVTWHN